MPIELLSLGTLHVLVIHVVEEFALAGQTVTGGSARMLKNS